ncbi:MAG: DUF4037 domain-containing protein [Bifidobacterium sp.]|jgi:tetratricopeptide (TPR) repeat protein|nr:DUF4037 domain-containing protein [Bifidobacterium sp.]MCH4175520.1 DUF4037 domain-containing protein [Bifidobacterium sp.]
MDHYSARTNSSTDQHNSSTVDIDAFFAGLDAIFAANAAPTQAEAFMLKTLHQARSTHDAASELTVLNELMGFLRSQGRHDDNTIIVHESLALAERMGIVGTEAWLTTLINAATSLRAAGEFQESEKLYQQALEASKSLLNSNDRRLAALHNNLSMLYSSTQRYKEAEHHLLEALNILERSSTNPEEDIDVASTHTNLALLLLNISGRNHEALHHAREAMNIYHQGKLEERAHYAAALASYAQVLFQTGHLSEAIDAYTHALAVIELHYGKDTEYYRSTTHNLEVAKSTLASTATRNVPSAPATVNPHTETDFRAHHAPSDEQTSNTVHAHTQSPDNISGLQLSRAYWEQYGKAMLSERYHDYVDRIAVGLVGHGSECYGFDDQYSHDHDFGPGFCLWLTSEDFQVIGGQLQQDYDALEQEFMGFGPRKSTIRAQGDSHRVGVFDIGEFFTSITGYPKAPEQHEHSAWLMLDEATLAAATNGEIFADPYGAFSRTRQGFKMMPENVRLSLISRRLGMIAQSGQYNFPRMISRGDSSAAWLCINEFVTAVSSLVFLINTPITSGYLPYYKWSFAALRRLSKRMASRLPQIAAELESILRIASAACFGGHGTAEGDQGARPAVTRVNASIEDICMAIVTELHEQGLSNNAESFLEWQRPYVEAHISSDDPCLHSV